MRATSYSNTHYSQGYTNYGQILGSGLDGKGAAAKRQPPTGSRHKQKPAQPTGRWSQTPVMLQGANLTDVAGDFSWLIKPQVELSTKLQYERWNFPVISNGPTSNFSAMFQIKLLNKRR